jgi:hypothetical protein
MQLFKYILDCEKKSLLTFLHNHSIVFYIPVIWQEHDTEQGWKKTFSGQVEVKNITECVLILFQKGYCYYCMTKPVVMINNVLEAIVVSMLHCEPSSNEYIKLLLYTTGDSTLRFLSQIQSLKRICVYAFTCRVFFNRIEIWRAHAHGTLNCDLPRTSKMKFGRKKPKMNALFVCV